MNSRSSCEQRQAVAIFLAQRTASSRVGNSSTVKPPLSWLAGSIAAETDPSPETSAGIHSLVDATAEYVNAGKLGFLDHRVSIGGNNRQFVGRHAHQFARKRDEIFCHLPRICCRTQVRLVSVLGRKALAATWVAS